MCIMSVYVIHVCTSGKNNANDSLFQSTSSAALLCVLCIGGFCLFLFVWVLIFFFKKLDIFIIS